MMKNRTLVSVIFMLSAVAAILGLFLAGLVLPQPGRQPPPLPPFETIVLFTTIKTVISSVNFVLILSLLAIYIAIYREIQSRFTLGLITLILILLLYAVTSNPLLHIVFGYYSSGLGPFTIIPAIFTTIALLVLLYLSME